MNSIMSGFSPPYDYDFINAYNSAFSPSTVHVKNTALALYFKRGLLQKAMSPFKWTIPEEWTGKAKSYMMYVLYVFGYYAIINTDKFGVIPQGCTLSGYDIFYQPKYCSINNPLIKYHKMPEIGKNCALIRLQPDYMGVMDLVNYYGDQKALLAEAVGVNAVNSKLSWAIAVKDKGQSASYKELYDRYASGEPAIFMDKSLLTPDGKLALQFINKDVKNSYIITDLLQDMRTLDNMFDTEIGIPNANTMKRERLITDEVNANNFETKSKCELWLETLQKGCEEARDIFGINLDVDWRDELTMSDVSLGVTENPSLIDNDNNKELTGNGNND